MSANVAATIEALSKRIFTLEQRITSPEYVVPNGSSPTFPEVFIGDLGDTPSVFIGKHIDPPTGMTATPLVNGSDVMVQLSWTAPAKAVEYEVTWYLKQINSTNYDIVDFKRTGGTSLTIHNLLPLREYMAVVQAVNSTGQLSDPSAGTTWATGKDSTIPSAVGSLSVTPGFSSLVAMWNISGDADVQIGGRYRVQVSTASNFSTTLYDRETTSTIVSFADLAKVPHYVRVAAIDASGNQGPWTTSTAVTPGEPTSGSTGDGAAPSSSPAPAVTSGVGFFFLKWAASGGTSDTIEYDIYISTDPTVPTGSTSGRVGTVTGTVSAIRTTAGGAPLSYDTDYYFRIIAKDRDGSAAPSDVAGPHQLAKATGDDIAVNAITAESGIIVSLDADKIMFGSMDGARIKAGTISTRELVIGDNANLITNGSFETYEGTGTSTNWLSPGLQAYFPSPSSPTSDVHWGVGESPDGTANINSGKMYAYIQFSTTTSTNMYLFAGIPPGHSSTTGITPGRIMAVPGQTYHFSVFSGVRGGSYTGTGVRAYLQFRSAAGSNLGSFLSPYTRPSSAAGVEGAKTVLSAQGVAPAGAAYIICGVQCASDNVHSSTTSTTFVFDDFTLYRQANGTMISDGVLTTSHVVTEGLSAEVIKFGTMSGDRITTSTLDANVIKTSTLTAGHITLSGATSSIRGGGVGTADTITSGSTGFVLNGEGFRLYKAGTATITLDAATGDATFTGTITTGATMSGSITSTATITGGKFRTSGSAVNRVEVTGDRVKFIPSSGATGAAYLSVANNSWGATYGQVLRLDGGYSSNDTSKFSRIIMSSGASGDTLIVETGDTGGRTDSHLVLNASGYVKIEGYETWIARTGTVNNIALTNDDFSAYYGTTSGNHFFRDWGWTAGTGTVRAGTITGDSAKNSKRDVRSMDVNALSIVRRAKKVKFRRPQKNSPEHYGFEAEDLEAIDPVLVSYLPTGELGGVDLGGLIALLCKAVAELADKVDSKADKAA